MNNTRLPVYVPVTGRIPYALIDPGSGIVGSNAEDWLRAKYGEPVLTVDDTALMIDYEGNRFGACNMVTFADRVFHAAGRHTEHYPTVARMAVDAEDVTQVGTFDFDSGHVELANGGADLLCEWLAIDGALLPEQLLRSDRFAA